MFDPLLDACPICRSPRIVPYDRDHEARTIDRCRVCGVRFLNPQYTDAHLRELYSRYTGVFATTFSGHDAAAPPDEADRARRLVQHGYNLSLVERFVDPGRFLSIGCGNGIDLEAAAGRGWEAEGYDVDERLTAAVAARTSATVHHGEFEQLSLPAQAYDCVYLHHVLEHPKDPHGYLRRCRALLKPEGVLFVACPNVDSLSGRAKRLLGRLRLKKRRGKQYDAWHHLFFFSPAVLRELLEARFGYEVLRVQGELRLLGFSRFTPLKEALLRAAPVLKSSFQLVARPRLDSR